MISYRLGRKGRFTNVYGSERTRLHASTLPATATVGLEFGFGLGFSSVSFDDDDDTTTF